MKLILKLISAAGLGLTVLPAFFVFNGSISWFTHATLMAAGTIVWFVSAPFWMNVGKTAPRSGKQTQPA